MMNKDNTKEEIKNSAYTPKEVSVGLANLPYNYAVKALVILQRKVDSGRIKKTYSKRYVQEVKLGKAFNEDILSVLVEVGLDAYNTRRKFGFKTKKTPST